MGSKRGGTGLHVAGQKGKLEVRYNREVSTAEEEKVTSGAKGFLRVFPSRNCRKRDGPGGTDKKESHRGVETGQRNRNINKAFRFHRSATWGKREKGAEKKSALFFRRQVTMVKTAEGRIKKKLV